MDIANSKTPNPLTAFRLLVLPILWVFALLDWQLTLAIGLGLAALSDILDGPLAKRWPRFSGGNFDSVADKCLTASVIVWLVLLKPFLFIQYAWLIAIATAVYGVSLLVGWRKHGRPSLLHTHLGKLGGACQILFVLHAFITHSYSPVLFYMAVITFGLAALEELGIQLLYSQIDPEEIRSIWPYVRQRLERQ